MAIFIHLVLSNFAIDFHTVAAGHRRFVQHPHSASRNRVALKVLPDGMQGQLVSSGMTTPFPSTDSLTLPAVLLITFAVLLVVSLRLQRTTAAATARNDFGPYSNVYDILGELYSLGAIRRTKLAGTQYFFRDSRVLFAGVGTGTDSVVAVAAGSMVTAIDISKDMLERCRTQVEAIQLASNRAPLRCICQDIMTHREEYDVVVANYFLNVFPQATSRAVLEHLCTLVRPGGVLLIGDFASSTDPILSPVQAIYGGIPALSFWFLAGNAVHTPYDYAAWLPSDMCLVSRLPEGPFHECLVVGKKS